jgi:hypothetical protein
MNNKLKKAVFEVMLREGFVKTSISISYNEETGTVHEAVLNHYKYGIIVIKDGYKDVHRWESEDEAQRGSYLSRRYTTILLNGVVDDKEFEESLFKAVFDELVLSDSNNRDMFIDILGQIGKGVKNISVKPGKQ